MAEEIEYCLKIQCSFDDNLMNTCLKVLNLKIEKSGLFLEIITMI